MTQKTKTENPLPLKPIQDFMKSMPVSEQVQLMEDKYFIHTPEDISRLASAKLAQERLENRQKNADAMLRRAAIPTRYVEASLNEGIKEQEKAYSQAQAFVDDFANRLKTGAGMVLWGDVGTGKTHLACAIANSLRKKMRPVMYCTAIEAVMLVKASWSKSSEGTEYDVYSRFGDPELLIIDEIGVQIGSEFERMVLTTIADIRSRNCRPTIIISNLEPEEMYELLGERMFDRLVGFGANVIHMAGRSMRLRSV